MFRVAILATLTTALIASCATVTVEQRRGAGNYLLAHRYGEKPDYPKMVETLAARAERVCAGSYHRVEAYDTSVGPKGWRLVWEIRCENVPQAFRSLPGQQPAQGGN